MTDSDKQQTNLQARICDALVRVFDASPDPHDGDASDMYVVDVFGMSVLIRLRATDPEGSEVFIHIDTESTEPGPREVTARPDTASGFGFGCRPRADDWRRVAVARRAGYPSPTRDRVAARAAITFPGGCMDSPLMHPGHHVHVYAAGAWRP